MEHANQPKHLNVYLSLFALVIVVNLYGFYRDFGFGLLTEPRALGLVFIGALLYYFVLKRRSRWAYLLIKVSVWLHAVLLLLMIVAALFT